MRPTSFTPTAGFLTEELPASTLQPTFEIQPLRIEFGPRLAKRRRRSAGMLIALCFDWADAAILASLSWLGGLVVTGLIQCACAHHAGDPDMVLRLQDTRAGTAGAGPRRSSSRAPRQ